MEADCQDEQHDVARNTVWRNRMHDVGLKTVRYEVDNNRPIGSSIHMTLSEWASKQGISDTTAWRWARQGTMPIPVAQTPTGTIPVKEPEATSRAVALYARVSSADQKADGDRHIARLIAYASEQGWAVTRSSPRLGLV